MELYPDRRKLELNELIEVRTKKVDELIANIPNVEASGFADQVKKHLKRIDEYSSIVKYLTELKSIKERDGNE